MLLHSAQIAAIPDSPRSFSASPPTNAIAYANGVTFSARRASAQGGLVLG